jgi:glucokinase
MILAGDIGGTKTALGLFSPDAAGLALIHYAEYPSSNFPSLEAAVARFLADGPAPRPALRAACFGVAGPVIAGRSELTNLSWRLDERKLSVILAGMAGVTAVKLVNDLEATAAGTPHLPPKDLYVLNEGEPPPEPRNIAVIAAGTGLGEAFLFWDGSRYRPSATEGGHTDFAPRGEEQIELLRHMARKTGGRVSYERVLSGAGLVSLHGFHRERAGEPEPGWLIEALAQGEGAAAIARAAADGSDGVCVKALETFAEIYGAEAGDQALKVMGLSGVCIGGGIAPKILPWLRDGRFMRAFADKGRFADMMGRIPVKVALNPKTGLIGAAWLAHEGSL